MGDIPIEFSKTLFLGGGHSREGNYGKSRSLLMARGNTQSFIRYIYGGVPELPCVHFGVYHEVLLKKMSSRHFGGCLYCLDFIPFF